MKIGILGGSFNPPHIGHLILGEEIRVNLGLDKVFFIPTNISPHKNKENLIESYHRLNMVRLSIEGNEFFEVLDWEIKRGGISYTIDTVRELKRVYPHDELFLIVGSELLEDITNWKDYRDIIKIVKLVVGQRKSFPIVYKKGIEFISVEVTQVDISSSYIRECLSLGKSIRYMVREKVREYILKNRLYI